MVDTSKLKFLKRFPEDKHQQILQIMSYIQMCGLTGRDLVSIGGHIDRQQAREQYHNAKERVKEYIDQKTICYIGKDSRDDIFNRFRYKGTNGDYVFHSNGWDSWDVTSAKNKVQKRFSSVGERRWPSHIHWTKRHFFEIVLDIAEGNIKLNF